MAACIKLHTCDRQRQPPCQSLQPCKIVKFISRFIKSHCSSLLNQMVLFRVCRPYCSAYARFGIIATPRASVVSLRPFPRMRKNLKRGWRKGRQMECQRGRISRDNETTSDSLANCWRVWDAASRFSHL